jgi:hypothetical protein
VERIKALEERLEREQSDIKPFMEQLTHSHQMLSELIVQEQK